MLLTIAILAPLCAALASIFVRANAKWLEGLTLAGSVVSAFSIFALLPAVLSAGAYEASALFSLDALGEVIALIVAMVSVGMALYSVGYMRQEVRKDIIGFKRVRQYYVLFNVFLFAMYAAAAATAPIVMWIAIEGTTLSTALLVSFYNKPSAMEAAWKYLILNSIGLLFGFVGTLLFTLAHNDTTALLTWHTLAQSAGALDPIIAKIAFACVLVGYGTKVGFAPLHTWKPDVYSKVPTPVAALFSTSLLSVAMLALMRFKIVTDIVVGSSFSSTLFIVFGMLSIFIAAFIIFTQWNYKRMLAYSSVEHAGIVALGLGWGGIGAFAALLHLLYHALFKSLLFSAVGNTYLTYSSTKIRRVHGMIRTLPITTTLFFLGILAALGVPPFGTFLTEWYIFSSGMTFDPFIATLAIALLVIVFIGFMRHLSSMAFGTPAESSTQVDGSFAIEPGEHGILTLLTPIVFAAILLVFGLTLPAPIHTLLTTASQSL
ncbi:MAG TPA: proton-conducting transporter membrane subunit [Candidatus Paceibacterota bacterium]